MTKTRKIVTVTASVLFSVMIAAGGYILFGGQVRSEERRVGKEC